MSGYAPHPVVLVSGERVGELIIRKRIGSGTFGTVYQAQFENDVFAIKFALRHPESDDLNRTGSRLQKELSCLLQIRHPHVVQAYAHGRWPHPTKGYPYILMEFVDGLTLHEWRRQRVPTLRQVLQLFGTLALTMDALDRAQIRHRDLKGPNILVRNSNGEPVLVDFGSAQCVNGMPLTEGLLPPGTPLYRSPESVRFQRENYRDPNAQYVPKLTDELYSLGVLGYEMVAGCPPFSPNLPREVLDLEIERRIPLPPVAFDNRLSSAMSQLILRLLSKRPEHRPQSGKALHEELQLLLREGAGLLDEKVRIEQLDQRTTER